ncbi:hypothetical protein HK096_004556 [Nowakowskiella sp. JEL0078]|nr:hypothetical protein HK096_004556 [Nowakowskiella sp. JEL0078]
MLISTEVFLVLLPPLSLTLCFTAEFVADAALLSDPLPEAAALPEMLPLPQVEVANPPADDDDSDDDIDVIMDLPQTDPNLPDDNLNNNIVISSKLTLSTPAPSKPSLAPTKQDPVVPSQPTKQTVDLNAVAQLDNKDLFDIDLESLDDKPWVVF